MLHCPAAKAFGCPFIAGRDIKRNMQWHLEHTHGFGASHAAHDLLLKPDEPDDKDRTLNDVNKACDKWLEEHPHDEWFNPQEMRQILMGRNTEAREKLEVIASSLVFTS